MKYLLKLRFLGTAYNGFQYQPKLPTVQGELMKAAEKLFLCPCSTVGCSRTDSGVHAIEYYASLRTEKDILTPSLPRALNNFLPDDIEIISSEKVPEDYILHNEIEGKQYKYLILQSSYRQPFLGGRCMFYPRKLDTGLLNSVCPEFTGTHDFRSFMASGNDETRFSLPGATVRTVTECFFREEDGLVVFYISADGFLYNMVRIIVGTAVEFCEGKINSITEVIEKKERSAAGRTFPAAGLYLNKVFLKERGER